MLLLLLLNVLLMSRVSRDSRLTLDRQRFMDLFRRVALHTRNDVALSYLEKTNDL